MYIYQDNKLYSLLGENELVGVDVYSDKVLPIDNTNTLLGLDYLVLTKREVNVKFHIDEQPYIFPIERTIISDEQESQKKDVVTKENDTVGKVKGTRARSKSV